MGAVARHSEPRAIWRRCLASWPVVDDTTRRRIDALPWRVRQVVVCVHGERLTVAATAARLGVGQRTVYYDLALADAQLAGSAAPLPDLADVGVRHLAAAILLQAWRDALQGNAEAPVARGWLRNHPWAEALCDGCDVDRSELVRRMDAALAERCPELR